MDNFLRQSSTQLTDVGLVMLKENLREDEIAVIFRNNHFSTLTKHGGALYTLVTDIGYEKEKHIVWEKFDTVCLSRV